MPIFVIERQYLLPVYQHLVIEAPDLAAACKEAIEGEHDWRPWKSAFAADGGPTSAVRLWQGSAS